MIKNVINHIKSNEKYIRKIYAEKIQCEKEIEKLLFEWEKSNKEKKDKIDKKIIKIQEQINNINAQISLFVTLYL